MKGTIANGKKLVAGKQQHAEKEDLVFANIICKHLKSNAIALVKNKQLIGKGCGQTSRIDSFARLLIKQSNSILICMVLF